MKFMSPITICNKIYKKIINFYYQLKYDFFFYKKKQTYLFNKLYLNRVEGLKKIEEIKTNVNNDPYNNSLNELCRILVLLDHIILF